MAETSKNKIYYNDDENSVADVLADMKKMAESTDKAIEKSKYDDTQIKKDISNIQKEQTTQNTNISNIKKEQETQNTNIEENNSKIVELQTEKAELETELKEAQEDFYQNSIRGQASGEYIHVEDSNGARCKIGISGNSEQETREGYNQFKTTITSTTVNGVTITKNNDSSISFSGTTTAGFTVQLVNYDNLEVTKKMYLKNCGTLENANFIVQLIRSGKTSVEYVPIRPDVTLNAGDIIQKIYVQQQFAGKAVSGTLDILLTDYENKDKGYEQYGAMPSLDYPSQVKTVGSNVNIIPTNQDDWEQGAIVPTTGIGQDSTKRIRTKDFIDIVENEDYFISLQDEQYCFLNIILYTSDEKYLGQYYNISSSIKGATAMKMVFPINCKKIKVTIRKKDNDSDIKTEEINIVKPKLEKGTVATPWSQHGQGCVKVTKCNKNLFDKYNAIKEYELNGSTGEITSNRLYFTSDYIRVNPNEQYYLSGKNTGNSNCFYNKDKEFISKINLENGLLTVPDGLNIYYLRINSRLTAIDTTMLEKNTKKSTYEQHQEQSYIMPVQAEMLEGDYFDFDNEEEIHTWNKLVLDGTEDGWLKREVASGEYRFEFPLSVVALNNNQTINILCDKLKGLTADATYLKQEGISASTWVQIYLKEFSQDKTVEDFKNWLKEHPLTTYYKLETPTRLKFTDEQKAVAKELNNARTYKNVTNITTDSKAILDLDYAKDLETLLNNTQALAVNNASEGV